MKMNKRVPKAASLARGLRSALLGLDTERRNELAGLSRAARPTCGRNDLLPRLELVSRDPHSLRAPKRNVRAVKPSHVKEVANAISTLAFRVPVIIGPDGTIIDGVVRVEAAKSLGLPAVPCVVADEPTSQEVRLLRLAANRLGEKGMWDVNELKIELQELVVEDAPIEITGFDDTEVDGLLAPPPNVVEKGSLEAREGDPVSQLGDVFRLGPHRVACGSALDTAAMSGLMAGNKVRFVFTDEPYNVKISGHVTKGPHREFVMASGEMSDEEFLGFNDKWIENSASYLVDGGVLATFIDWRGLPIVLSAALGAGLSQINLVVWSKSNAGMGSLYRSQHELLPMFVKGEAAPVNNVEMGKRGRWRSNVWGYAGASSIRSDSRRGLKEHPTVKPVVMLCDAIVDLTHRGEIVLDPFLGSGSTLIACHETERVCYGMELDPRYVDVIVRRFQEVTGEIALLERTGEPFDQLALSRLTPPPPNPATAPQPGQARLRPNRRSGPSEQKAA